MQHPVPAGDVDALLRASRALVGVAARSLADVDVTLPQLRALVVISERPGTTVSGLAATLGIHPTTSTRLCDRLVRKRLIRRIEGTDDRRHTELRLAAGGRRLVDQVTERRRRDLAAIVARMGQPLAEHLLSALDAFAAAADDAVGDADVLGWPASQQ